jgi:hypothetical protein
MQYTIANGPMQTTAAFAAVGTGTAIKTLLQIKLLVPARVIAWGVSWDGFTAATPGRVELCETGSIFGTVTASAAADITGHDAEAVLFGDPTSNYISVGTSATGYTCSSEGSIVAVRNLDGPELLPPTGPFVEQFPLGEEPFMQAAKAFRIRCTFATGINAYAWCTLAF